MNELVFLETERLSLRPLVLNDIDGNYKNWLNNQEIVKFNSHGRFPQTIESLKSFVLSANNTNRIVLAIVAKDGLAHIGNISLQAINWIDRNAEIAFILGDKDYWGKGIMLEAGSAIIAHAFSELNLHRVHCGTSSQNIGMQRLAEKLGMSKEGVRKDAIFSRGGYYDIIEYGIINC